MYNFEKSFSFQDRFEESSRVLSKYPDKIPIICEKAPNQHNLPDIDKKKYIVPFNITVGQFIYVIRKRLCLRSDEGLFLFVNNRIVSGSSFIGHIYEHSKNPDGFLYIEYCGENVFG